MWVESGAEKEKGFAWPQELDKAFWLAHILYHDFLFRPLGFTH